MWEWGGSGDDDGMMKEVGELGPGLKGIGVCFSCWKSSECHGMMRLIDASFYFAICKIYY